MQRLAERGTRNPERGFTLVELLVVITIIAVLAGILFPVVFKGQGQADKAKCAALIQQLGAAITTFEGQYGDYPPSTFARFRTIRDSRGNKPYASMTTPTNGTNTCSEALVIALTCEVGGIEPFDWAEDMLENTDGDKLSGAPGWALADEAFEVVDPWGFPIVYIHKRDYGKKFKLLSVDGETVTATAQKSEKLKGWQRRRTYQLYSCGPDGQPGTDDDIKNW